MAFLRLTRRTFVARLGAVLAAIGLRPRPATAQSHEREVQAGLPLAPLSALAVAILPSELGRDGSARVARTFAAWIAAYRAGAEVLHPYGSDEIDTTGPSPMGRWREQLAALETAARAKHQRAFTALGVDEQQQLVHAALDGMRVPALPSPLRAEHVAVALLSFYFGSAEATDLCYRAQIRKQQCRPLVHNGRRPLPLAERAGP